MIETSDSIGFSGVLGRSSVGDGTVTLRFYPYAFSAEPGDLCVLTAHFRGAKFSEAEIAPLVGDEVDVDLFTDRAELFFYLSGDGTTLHADAVIAEWSPYDLEDYRQRVAQLDDAYDRTNDALVKAVQKDRKSLELARELMRRAEIKAAASDEHRTRQAAAIAVLDRLLRHLEGTA